eukprot:366303-Chlamydomonas_euryale.AAC.7
MAFMTAGGHTSRCRATARRFGAADAASWHAIAMYSSMPKSLVCHHRARDSRERSVWRMG